MDLHFLIFFNIGITSAILWPSLKNKLFEEHYFLSIKSEKDKGTTQNKLQILRPGKKYYMHIATVRLHTAKAYCYRYMSAAKEQSEQ